MKLKEGLVGVFAAIASALASVAVFNRALKDDKTSAAEAANTGARGGETTLKMSNEERHPAGFLPRKEQPQEQKQALSERAGVGDEHRLQPGTIPPGWSEPEPKEIPRPTYWPIVMAVAITFIFWGIVTSLIISGVGILLFALSLAGWIGDIRHENAHD